MSKVAVTKIGEAEDWAVVPVVGEARTGGSVCG